LKLSRSCIQSRYLWAIIAGLLLAASFPSIGIAGLALQFAGNPEMPRHADHAI